MREGGRRRRGRINRYGNLQMPFRIQTHPKTKTKLSHTSKVMWLANGALG